MVEKKDDPALLKGYAGTSKEGLLQVVRDVIAAEGGRISKQKFLRISGMKEGEALRFHAGWNELLREAGCKEEQPNKKVEPERLLSDWGAVTRKLKRTPSWSEYRIHGTFTPTTFVEHFGAWSKVEGKFRAFSARRYSWRDVRAMLPPSDRAAVQSKRARRRAMRALHKGCGRRLEGRPMCGERLTPDKGGLRNAPVNELGVVFAFGMMAEELGFSVEGLQAGFPDCEAKRRVAPGVWQTVWIEFEYESRNFRTHKHDAEGCDLIVCWVDNWEECPVEVLSLRDNIAQRKEVTSESGK